MEVEVIQISLDQAQNMLIPPTIAEERIARMLAVWHGQVPIYKLPGGGTLTVASQRGSGTGWAWELDRYVENHWTEYLDVARAVMELR